MATIKTLELLEAAKALCDDFGDNLKSYDIHRWVLVEELRAAIAKAETVETNNPQTRSE